MFGLGLCQGQSGLWSLPIWSFFAWAVRGPHLVMVRRDVDPIITKAKIVREILLVEAVWRA